MIYMRVRNIQTPKTKSNISFPGSVVAICFYDTVFGFECDSWRKTFRKFVIKGFLCKFLGDPKTRLSSFEGFRWLFCSIFIFGIRLLYNLVVMVEGEVEKQKKNGEKDQKQGRRKRWKWNYAAIGAVLVVLFGMAITSIYSQHQKSCPCSQVLIFSLLFFFLENFPFMNIFFFSFLACFRLFAIFQIAHFWAIGVKILVGNETKNKIK